MSIYNLIIHAIFWLFGFLVIWKINYCETSMDRYNKKTVSIIIPARNEEKNLPVLINSIKKQNFNLKEIILVDDSSSDSTPKIGRNFKIRVLTLNNLPPGWVGKSWACYNGAKIATGDYLIFLDADTTLLPGAINNITSCLYNNGGVLSIQPYHQVKKFYENLSLFFNIILMAGIGVFTPLQSKVRPIGAFGPCLACSKSNYFKIHGHRDIKGEILEDIEIGKKFINEGIDLSCYGGKGTINFRMYPGGLKELIKGWSKSFTMGAGSTSIPILLMIIAWIFGAIFPVNLLVRGLIMSDKTYLLYSLIFYIAFMIQVYWMSYRIGNFHIIASIFYPFTLIFFIIIFFYSMFLTIFKKKVSWKDRDIKV